MPKIKSLSIALLSIFLSSLLCVCGGSSKDLNPLAPARMDMTEFFDFTNPPWITPPSPPSLNTGGAYYMDHLP